MSSTNTANTVNIIANTNTDDTVNATIYSIISSKPNGITSESLQEILVNSMGIHVKSSVLMESLNNMANEQSIVFLTLPGGKLVLKARSKEEADQLKLLSDDERIILSFIKESHNKGAWIKHIKDKSGLHTKVVTDVIARLEKKKIIKKIASVKQPTKKVYMLYDVEPSAELTGGSWYTDNNMDVEFIDQLSSQIQKYIFARSRPADKTKIYPVTSHFPATTILDIHEWITRTKVSSQPLSVQDVEALVMRGVWDGKCEKVEGEEFFVSTGNGGGGGGGVENVGGGFSESPCGTCPVFEFCKKDGPVSPATCQYLSEWLNR